MSAGFSDSSFNVTLEAVLVEAGETSSASFVEAAAEAGATVCADLVEYQKSSSSADCRASTKY